MVSSSSYLYYHCKRRRRRSSRCCFQQSSPVLTWSLKVFPHLITFLKSWQPTACWDLQLWHTCFCFHPSVLIWWTQDLSNNMMGCLQIWTERWRSIIKIQLCPCECETSGIQMLTWTDSYTERNLGLVWAAEGYSWRKRRRYGTCLWRTSHLTLSRRLRSPWTTASHDGGDEDEDDDEGSLQGGLVSVHRR